MFGVGAATRIYLAAGTTDMRKGFNGLYGIVRDQLECDPLSGHVFLFVNAQTQPAEGFVLGRQWSVGVREAIWRKDAFAGRSRVTGAAKSC